VWPEYPASILHKKGTGTYLYRYMSGGWVPFSLQLSEISVQSHFLPADRNGNTKRGEEKRGGEWMEVTRIAADWSTIMANSTALTTLTLLQQCT
jgi:hypothetical protein